MNTCPNCGKINEAGSSFCVGCGYRFDYATTQYAPNQYAPSQYAPNQYSPSQYSPAPVSLQQPAPKNIAGMVLAIVGFSLSILAAIYGLMGLLFAATVEIDEGMLVFGICGLLFSAISLPFSIVGLLTSKKRIYGGYAHKTATLGKTFGLVGTIIGGAVAFIAFLLLVASA